MSNHNVKSILQVGPSESVLDLCVDRLAQTVGASLNLAELPEESRRQSDWGALLDKTLLAWQRDLNLLADEEEGIEPPSRETVSHTCGIVRSLADRGLPAPTRIVPDADRGIVVKWRTEGGLAALEFSDDGTIEFIVYTDGRVESSEPIPLPASG
jgi:hypothetical protein